MQLVNDLEHMLATEFDEGGTDPPPPPPPKIHTLTLKHTRVQEYGTGTRMRFLLMQLSSHEHTTPFRKRSETAASGQSRSLYTVDPPWL